MKIENDEILTRPWTIISCIYFFLLGYLGTLVFGDDKDLIKYMLLPHLVFTGIMVSPYLFRNEALPFIYGFFAVLASGAFIGCFHFFGLMFRVGNFWGNEVWGWKEYLQVVILSGGWLIIIVWMVDLCKLSAK